MRKIKGKILGKSTGKRGWSIHKLMLEHKHKIKELITDIKVDTESNVLKGKFFKQYLGNCVYVWKRKDSYMYVGLSKTPFVRMSHHLSRGGRKIRSSDTVEVIRCASFEDAELLEACLIVYHKPLYNDEGVYPHSTGMKNEVIIHES